MKREEALRRIEARRGFFIHLTVYVVVCTVLVVINLLNAPENLWAHWPILGWGIGVAVHGLGVFFGGDRFVITEDMVEREMQKG